MPKQAEFNKYQQMYYAGLELVQLGQLSEDLKITHELTRKGFQMIQESTPKLSADYFDEFCGTVPRKLIFWPKPWPGPWPFPWTNFNKPQPDPVPFLQMSKYGILEALGQFKTTKLDPALQSQIGELRGSIEKNF